MGQNMAAGIQDDKTLKFIETIRIHPCLYNTDLEDYRNVWRKSEIWDSIAETFGYYDADAAKMAWKKLRDNYREALRRQSIPRKLKGQRGEKVAKQTRNWLYQTEMEFLLPYMSNRVPDNYLEHIPIEKLYRPVNVDVADPLGGLKDESSVTLVDESSRPATAGDSPPYREDASPAPVNRRREEECQPKEVIVGDFDFVRRPKRRSKETRARERRKLIGQVLQRAKSSTPLDHFFSSMCQTTKTFPQAYQVEVKRTLFKIVTDFEEKLLGFQQSEASRDQSPSESSNVRGASSGAESFLCRYDGAKTSRSELGSFGKGE